MRSAGVLVLAACGLACCDGGPGISRAELMVRVTAGDAQTLALQVESGRAFPLQVLRVWNADLVPDDWRDDALAPLVLRPVETTRRQDAGQVEELRRFQAYAFSLADLEVPGPVLRARPRTGGAERAVTGNTLALEIRPALDRAVPGPVELPGDLMMEPGSSLSWWLGSTALLLALMALAFRRRRRPGPAATPAVEPAVPEPGPHVRAEQRLRALRQLQPRDHDELQAYYVEASGLLRDYIEARFPVRAREMTTEEFVASAEVARALAARHRDAVGELLGHCDLVKFARHRPVAAERERVLATAETFLHETRPAPAPGNGAP